MDLRRADSGEEFIINCAEHHDKSELAVIWYELDRQGEKITGISSTICFACAKVIYADTLSEEELTDIYGR